MCTEKKVIHIKKKTTDPGYLRRWGLLRTLASCFLSTISTPLGYLRWEQIHKDNNAFKKLSFPM